MTENFKRLESYVILSPEDIKRFRNYIASRYSSDTKITQANVLANTIHRVVDRYLGGITPELLPSIKQGLFKHFIAGEKESITKLDVFNEIALQDISIIDACLCISNWINVNEKFDLRMSDISSNIYSLRRPYIDVTAVKKEALKEILSVNNTYVPPVIVESETLETSGYFNKEIKTNTITNQNTILNTSRSSNTSIIKNENNEINNKNNVVVSIDRKKRALTKNRIVAIASAAAIFLFITSGFSLNSFFSKNYNNVATKSNPTKIAAVKNILQPFIGSKFINIDLSVSRSKITRTKPNSTTALTLVSASAVNPELTPVLTPVFNPEINHELTPEINQELTPEITTILTPEITLKQTPRLTPKTTPKTNSKTSTKHILNSSVKKSAKFPYRKIDYSDLKFFLKESNSILSEDKYLKPILEISEANGLDPRLLISIAGQEQSLVPKSHPNAKKIANNPFNVFHSWQEYNTNIADSTAIACRTINRLLIGCPDNFDALTWLNKSYATDKNWQDGVRFFYDQLIEID